MKGENVSNPISWVVELEMGQELFMYSYREVEHKMEEKVDL